MTPHAELWQIVMEDTTPEPVAAQQPRLLRCSPDPPCQGKRIVCICLLAITLACPLIK